MTDRIERELLLPAPLAAVWALVTTDGWLAERVELDLVPGGDACFSSCERVKTGWVEEVLAPDREDGHPQEGTNFQRRAARLAFWWASGDEPATRVELTLEGTAEGNTRLRVVETRPLERLGLVGLPLPGIGGPAFGPALVAA
jgi:uncharacterized protein YndB with AHSA1/START domain